MSKTVKASVFLGACALGLALAGGLAAEEGGKTIMEKSELAMTISGMESVSTLTISDGKGHQRVRKFSTAQKKYPAEKVSKTIMRFVEPADVKGTSILTFDYEEKEDSMWLYMPALRKVRRIVSSEKTKSFMGSEFSNADILRQNVDDYTYNVLGSETQDGVECWKIENLPATKDVANSTGYSRKISWIGKNDYVQRKMELYGFDGKLVKIMLTEKIKLMDEKNKRYQTLDITMENKSNGRSSRILMEKADFNPNVKDEYFTTNYLQK
jgi:outer membrane lipoprotein-sorting protein